MKLERKITRQKLIQFLESHRTDKRTLDIGAGDSYYAKFFPNRLSIDIDPARKPDMVADIHKLPFKDEEFEVILCTEVLEHLPDPKKASSEMHRVLKRGGKLILTTRFVYPLHDTPHDYFRYTKYGLREIFKDFKDIEIIPETRSFSALAVLVQRICYQSKLRGGKVTKLILFVIARILVSCDSLVLKEWGGIQKDRPEQDIISSGYYMTARK